MNKVLFKICNDTLIVANTGAPFTREGVISICYLYPSEKDEKNKIEDDYECKKNEEPVKKN